MTSSNSFMEQDVDLEFINELGEKHGVDQVTLTQVKELLASKFAADELKLSELTSIGKKLLQSQLDVDQKHED